MRAYAVSTVIDLRSDSELYGSGDPRFPRPKEDRARQSGVAYVHHALIDDSGLKRLGEASNMFERYLLMLSTRQMAFRDVFTSIAEAEGGVVFHCFAGKDRTGLIAAMLLAMAKVSAETIASDFGETDVQLAKQYEKWISEVPADLRNEMREELRCPPERILGVLNHLQTKWGGVEAYLEASGVAPANIDRLTARLE